MLNLKNKEESMSRQKKQEPAKESSSKILKIEEKQPSPTISFDVYFQMLMKERPEILSHHKAPLRAFVKSRLGNTATKEDFDKVLKSY